MADKPRVETDLAVDPPATGTAPANLYAPGRELDDVTIAPDHRPHDEQPQWRKDFAIDLPEATYVARRDFAKFLVLTSGAFAIGHGWVAVQSLLRNRRVPPPRKKIASLAAMALGTAITFTFPDDHDTCLLIRTREDKLVAYSQKCTHLSCAVVPKLEEGVLHCPCHEGYFDLLTGRNIAGPPPRPLPVIELAIEGDDVFAVAVKARNV